MAYLRDIHLDCNFRGCGRRATVEVFNRMNSPQGRFCREHGKACLRELMRGENSGPPIYNRKVGASE